MSKRGLLYTVLVASSIIALLGFFLLDRGIINLPSDTSKENTKVLETVLLERRDLKEYEDFDGILEYGLNSSIYVSTGGILRYVAPEGTLLERGDIIYSIHNPVSASQLRNADQQILSAELLVAQAAVAFENITAPATEAQIASAEASIAQAELALHNLTTPSTESQIASAEASIAQAEASLSTIENNELMSLVDLITTRNSFCQKALSLDLGEMVYDNGLCPSDNSSLSAVSKDTLVDLIIDNQAISSTANNLLIANNDYISISKSVNTARKNLSAAVENRLALNDQPSELQLNNAQQSLAAANKHYSALLEPASESEIDQAERSLKSALEHRVSLDQPPTDLTLQQSEAASANALKGLENARVTKDELLSVKSSHVLMYGEKPAWRDFRIGIDPGQDLEQLKLNLISLGYGEATILLETGLGEETSTAIKAMQKELGVNETGWIELGQVIFLQGRSLVAYSSSFPSSGTEFSKGSPLMDITTIDEVITSIHSGKIQTHEKSLQRVLTSVPVADQDLVTVGAGVEIELPDETSERGYITDIGTLAVIPQANQSGNPYLEVTVSLDGNIDLHQWTGAQVTVSVTKHLASNALAAPVTSLLALLDGGYALELQVDGSTELIPVEVGIFADGWVEIKGTNLEAGTIILMPS